MANFMSQEDYHGLMHEHAQTVGDRADALSEIQNISTDFQTRVGLEGRTLYAETSIPSIAGPILETVVTERLV